MNALAQTKETLADLLLSTEVKLEVESLRFGYENQRF